MSAPRGGAPAEPTHVVGFLFDGLLSRVVLICKARPAWQAGRLNGVGGKIEPGESSVEAMRREFREETGWAEAVDWHRFCRYECQKHASTMDFFTARSFEAFDGVRTTDPSEPIARVWLDGHTPPTPGLPLLSRSDVIPNLRFLIPMARNFLAASHRGDPDVFDIREIE